MFQTVRKLRLQRPGMVASVVSLTVHCGPYDRDAALFLLYRTSMSSVIRLSSSFLTHLNSTQTSSSGRYVTLFLIPNMYCMLCIHKGLYSTIICDDYALLRVCGISTNTCPSLLK